MKSQPIHSRLIVFVSIALSLLFFVNNADAKQNKKEGFLGVTVESLSHEEKREEGIAFGVYVWKVMKDSPADKAGLKEDDIIQYYNNNKIRNPADLTEYVRRTEPGTEVQIALFRQGDPKKITVTIGTKKYSKQDKQYYSILADQRAYLGVKLQDMNEDLAPYFKVKENEGALILEVTEDSPAEDAGIKPGDVILKIEDETIREAEDVKDLMDDYETGETVTIQIKRRGRIQNFRVELGGTPKMFDFEFPAHWNDHSSWDNQSHSSQRLVIPDVEMDWDEIGGDIQVEINGEMQNLGEELRRCLENFSVEAEI